MASIPERVKLSSDEVVRGRSEAASHYIRVLDAVSDPGGDADRYRLAWELIRHAFVETEEFDEVMRRYLTWLRLAPKEPFITWLSSGGQDNQDQSPDSPLLSATLN